MMVQQDLWSSDILAPDEFAFVFADPTKKTGLDGYFNGFKDLAIWKLVQEAGAGNEAQRTKLWPQIQKLWLTDMPWMSIMWLPTVSGIRSTVCDVPVNALGWYQFQDSWLSNA
jgi:ABC-type transport system substrate-binding protein